MKLNWDKIEEENKSQYKNYAPDGKYTTKVESVEVVTAITGNKGIRFNLAENDDYKFPKYGHTFYNSKRDSWRQHHMKECFVALGFTEDQAKKAVEKLKAWKRLKDGGITFKNWTINQTGTIDCFATWGDNIPPSRKNPTLLEDLDLLFGGEE